MIRRRRGSDENPKGGRSMYALLRQMEDAYSTAQRITQRIGASDTEDVSARTEVDGLMQPFEEAVRTLLQAYTQPPSVFHDLGIHTSIPEDIFLFPISYAKKEIENVEDLFTDAFRSLMRRLAALADALAHPSLRFPCFLEDCLACDEEGQLYASWMHLSTMRLASGQTQFKPHQRAMRHAIHPQLLRAFPEDLEAYLPFAMRYSFALFFLRLLHPMAEQLVHQRALDRLRVWLPWLPPALPRLLVKATSTELLRLEQGACVSFWKDVEALFEEMLQNKKDQPLCCLDREKESYQISGRYKPGPLQDAELCAPLHSKDLWMGGVADGVSTADLGSGEAAAQEVARCFFMLGTEAGRVLAEPMRWPVLAEDFLCAFAETANQAIAQRCTLLQASHPAPETIQDPMSSTFVAAVLLGDRAVIAWLGDSPAWHYQARESALIRLTVEDTQLHARMRDGEWNALDASNEGDSHLSHYLGMSYRCENTGVFVPCATTPHLLHRTLQEGDILLLASDGLLCGKADLAPHHQDQILEEKIKEYLQKDSSLRGLVFSLVEDANQHGDDNISLVAVRVSKRINETEQSAPLEAQVGKAGALKRKRKEDR